MQAVGVCKEGGIIAYPTEAVFGLGCLPVYEHAVRRILKLKYRSVKKGLIVVASEIEQLESYVEFSSISDISDIKSSWPGPVTWLIPVSKYTPSWLTGSHESLAVRVSAHPVVRLLCEKLGPIVSTSANPQGAIPARTSQRVRSYFRNNIDYICPGRIAGAANPT
ncbi:MAG: Sua5/YciO/YrdC/YwlC family protein, partial [Proteobacteria bacterium]|nr:Sua5/YciO/YrdC/YwlC family protein [Pseudomonadota bacterium]